MKRASARPASAAPRKVLKRTGSAASAESTEMRAPGAQPRRAKSAPGRAGKRSSQPEEAEASDEDEAEAEASGEEAEAESEDEQGGSVADESEEEEAEAEDDAEEDDAELESGIMSLVFRSRIASAIQVSRYLQIARIESIQPRATLEPPPRLVARVGSQSYPLS